MTLLHHPECACCGKPHNGEIGGMLAVYEGFFPHFFPHLHQVCKSCFSRYESLWEEMESGFCTVSSPEDFSQDPLTIEMCKDAPEWSMIRKSLKPHLFYFCKVEDDLRRFSCDVYHNVNVDFWEEYMWGNSDNYY